MNSPNTRQSNDDYNELSEITRSEALDVIDEAWEESTTKLHLHHVHLDRFAMHSILEKFDRDSSRIGERQRRKIEKLELNRCSFRDKESLRILVILMHMIGRDLREMVYVDSKSGRFHFHGTTESILFGLNQVPLLRRLSLEKVDFRGKQIGLQLQILLKQCFTLQYLRLYGCSIDSDAFGPFLIGLRGCAGLVRLDLNGWNLDDSQCDFLVAALMHSASKRTLKLLELSRSSIGLDSLRSLARLLDEAESLKVLALSSCQNLLVGAKPDSPAYLDFAAAIRSSSTLRELEMEHILFSEQLATPLLRAIKANTFLRKVNIEVAAGGQEQDNNAITLSFCETGYLALEEACI